jgi:beta-mannosidase
VNDHSSRLEGELRLTLYNANGAAVEEAISPIKVDGHSEQHWNAATLLGGFRDLTNAYRFGPPAYDLVRARLEAGDTVSEAFHLPLGLGRRQEPDLGLEAHAAPGRDNWQLTVLTRRFAQWVVIDVPGFAAQDSWFHLAPGSQRTVVLRPLDGSPTPKGRVRAVNALHSSPVVVED